MGILGGTVILAVSPLASAALTLSGTAKEYLRIMFFVMSYFVVGQVPFGRRYEIRIDSRYDDDVVLLDIVRFSCGICI